MIDKTIGTIVLVIIGLGLLFWAFNNPNGLGDASSDGATKVNTKISGFNYNGSVAPGSGQTAP